MNRVARQGATLPEALLVGYCLLAPIVPQLQLGSLRLGITDVLLPAALFAILLRGRAKPYPAAAFLLLYLAAAGISVAAMTDTAGRWESGLRVVRLAGIVAPFFLGMAVPRPTPKLLRRAVIAFLASGAASMSVAVVGFAYQAPGLTSAGTFIYPVMGHVHRAGGIAGDSSSLGHLVATWLAVTLFLSPFLLSKRTARTLLPAATALAALALVASLSRSAVLSTATAVAVALVVSHGGRRASISDVRGVALRSALVVGGGLMCLFLVTSRELFDLIRGRLFLDIFGPVLGTGSPAEIASGRIENWALLLNLLTEKPLTGVGYKALILVHGLPPDNNYLQALVETGILGLLGLLGFMGSLVVSFARRLTSGQVPGWPFLVLWCGQLVHAFFVDTVTFWPSMPVVLALSALGLRLCSTRPSRQENAARGLR